MKSRLKEILVIAGPLIVANSFWNLQLTIDRIFLGMHSTEALGAAMAVMGVFWVPMALLQQTSSYVTTFVAQYYGAKSDVKIAVSFWQAIYVSVVGGILFLSLNWFSDAFFSWVGHGDKIRHLESAYFKSLGYSALPMALVAAISGFFTGLGRSQIVMAINFVGLLLNVALDYAMIFGNFGFPAYGIEGAGYATALATYGAAVYGVYLIFTSKHAKEYEIRKHWSFDFKMCRRFLKYGIPSGLQWAFEGLAFTTFLIIMGNLNNGEAALAGSSIAVTLMMLSVLPSMGIAQAVMTLVGQRLGEKKIDLAQQVAWDGALLSSIYMILVGLSLATFPQFYISWFHNEGSPALWSQVMELTPQLLKLVAIFTMFDGIYLNISFALKGAGDTRFVSLMALTVPWPLMVLPTYFFRHFENAAVIGWCFAAVYVVTIALTLIFRFRAGKWKKMSVMAE